MLIGVDAALRRYVLVALPDGEPDALTERVSRGIGVQTVRMVPRDTGREASFIEIACLEAQGHPALDIVIDDLADALDRAGSLPRVSLVQGVLAKWRRFWSNVPSGALSVEQQIGLFGELYFLVRWMCLPLTAAKAVSTWRGPMGARNDFEMPGLGIEVKTTKRVDAIHIIHGLDQLLDPPRGALLLFGLAVRDEASATESLPRLVREMRSRIGSDLDALNTFDNTLYAAGYDDRLESEYDKLLLRIRSEGLYRVADDFPRLVPASIQGGVPPGIGLVQYELRLDAASSWMVASSSQAATKLLADFSR